MAEGNGISSFQEGCLEEWEPAENQLGLCFVSCGGCDNNLSPAVDLGLFFMAQVVTDRGSYTLFSSFGDDVKIAIFYQ